MRSFRLEHAADRCGIGIADEHAEQLGQIVRPVEPVGAHREDGLAVVAGDAIGRHPLREQAGAVGARASSTP